MILSCEEFGRSLKPPLTKQRIYQLLGRGDLIKEAKKINTDNPTNAAWLAGYPHHSQPKPVNYAGSVAAGGTPVQVVPRPVATPEEIDAEALLEQVANLDLRTLSKAIIDKIRVLETALKIRVERQQRMGLLIERKLVSVTFGKLYQIDTNELRPIGAALSPEIAGVLGVDDPEKILQVEQIIDAKVMKVLAHIQRLMNDFLVRVGAEETV
jgi:hypothetical protein